jgi:hypothetical protein
MDESYLKPTCVLFTPTIDPDKQQLQRILAVSTQHDEMSSKSTILLGMHELTGQTMSETRGAYTTEGVAA